MELSFQCIPFQFYILYNKKRGDDSIISKLKCYMLTAANILSGSALVGRAINCRPVLRKAYNDMLEKYDALIMPTIPFVAARLPAAELTPVGKKWHMLVK